MTEIVIRSTNGRASLTNIRPSGANPALTHIDVVCGLVAECVAFPTADLAAALGLVTRERLDDMRQAYEAKIQDFAKETRRASDMQLLAEKYASQEADAVTERDALRAELDQANATIARVRECVEAAETDRYPDHQGAVQCIRAALDPKPPFELPTEAGAMFTAKTAGEATLTFKTFTAGADVVYVAEGEAFTASEVMEFTDHRLIEAKP